LNHYIETREVLLLFLHHLSTTLNKPLLHKNKPINGSSILSTKKFFIQKKNKTQFPFQQKIHTEIHQAIDEKFQQAISWRPTAGEQLYLLM
jgi:hypothetical protein